MLKDIPFLQPVLDVVLHHHERLDGTGYPSGLVGENIPLSARIFSVADTFDAMTNDRPYRKAFSQQEAVVEIERCVNKQFDPAVVVAFKKAFERGWEVSPHTRENRKLIKSSMPVFSEKKMNQLSSHTRIPFLTKRSVLLKDAIIPIGWAFLSGIPLFVVHMMLFDFEHSRHIDETYSLIQSITDTVPHHPISLALWLSAIFVAAFAIRRAFQQQVMLIRAQKTLVLSHTQALTDGLTGVWNRAGFELLQETVITRARDQACSFSIILGDVDGLKKYNDTYGHPQADLVLKQIVRIMLTQIRASDAVARYGGDEFAIFCFDLERDGAEWLVDRLTAALKNAPLSMSFGIASFPMDGKDAKTLIETADLRLYQAKAENHNSDNSHHRNSDCQCDDCRRGNEDKQVKPLAADL